MNTNWIQHVFVITQAQGLGTNHLVSSFSMQTIATQDSERRDNAVEFAALETAKKLGRVNFAKTSGTVTRDRRKKLANS